jgi:uncharacterized damage-inducible protein DinB
VKRNRYRILAAGVAVFSICASAQTPPTDPLTKTSKGFYSIVIGNIVKAAEEMPEANYSYKPTPEVRTFAQLIGHVADAQYSFCGKVSGDTSKRPSMEETKTAKADLIQGLKDSVAYCQAVYAGLTDAKGSSEMVKFYGTSMPKLSILEINVAHADEHYGNIVTYLRLKGLVPPSSQK